MAKRSRSRDVRFPLTLHRATGQWLKVFRLPTGQRKTVYFGQNREQALAKYVAERDEWQAGRNPRDTQPASPNGTLPLDDVVNAFLTRSKRRVAEGALSPVSYADYMFVGKCVLEHFGRACDPGGLGAQDFAQFRAVIASRYAPSRLSKTITVTRMIFRWAHEAEVIDRPPRFGPDFKAAPQRAHRAAKAEAGSKLLMAAEVRKLLKAAPQPLQAMVYLGLNCGLGNADIAALPLSALDLDGGWLNFPRPKTGVNRRVPLWPETIAALRKVLKARRPREGAAHLVFVTSRGGPWATVKPDGRRVDQIIPHFRAAAKAAKIDRPRLGFYWLRHTCQTIGDEAKDPIATMHVMGHADGSISGHYREAISDDRLRAVVDHVRQWLKATPAKSTLRVVG